MLSTASAASRCVGAKDRAWASAARKAGAAVSATASSPSAAARAAARTKERSSRRRAGPVPRQIADPDRHQEIRRDDQRLIGKQRPRRHVEFEGENRGQAQEDEVQKPGGPALSEPDLFPAQDQRQGQRADQADQQGAGARERILQADVLVADESPDCGEGAFHIEPCHRGTAGEPGAVNKQHRETGQKTGDQPRGPFQEGGRMKMGRALGAGEGPVLEHQKEDQQSQDRRREDHRRKFDDSQPERKGDAVEPAGAGRRGVAPRHGRGRRQQQDAEGERMSARRREPERRGEREKHRGRRAGDQSRHAG
jgi:hypothetical protein